MYIGIIGHFGGNKKFTDGQTVKTNSIYLGFQHRGVTNIICADTYQMRHNPFKFISELSRVLLSCQNIIVLLSNRGRKILFPIFYRISKKKNIYHYAIGGKLAEEVKNNETWKKYINSFNGNWVESMLLVDKLKALGVNNAVYIPNFKCINILNENELLQQFDKPYKFCMFSRVMKEKGVEDAINAIKKVNEKKGYRVAQLDIYGPIESEYKERFNQVLVEGGGYSNYCGVVSPNDSVKILREYYMLLFPSFWKGEGMPGTVIDAFSAGLPIIARHWEYCDEMINDSITGYVYDFNQPGKLDDLIWYAINHPEKTLAMKRNCLKKAEEYSEFYVMQQIMQQMKI